MATIPYHRNNKFMKSTFYHLSQLPGRALLLLLAVWLAAVSGYGQSGSFGNTFIFGGAEMAVHGASHSFQNGGSGVQPGIVGTTRTSPQGYLSFVGAATAVDAADGAHVDGYVKKYGTTAFTFPVGSGSDLRTLAISAPPAAATYAVAWIAGNPTNAGAFHPAADGLDAHPLSREYGQVMLLHLIA